jgi:hypothetical protein
MGLQFRGLTQARIDHAVKARTEEVMSHFNPSKKTGKTLCLV